MFSFAHLGTIERHGNLRSAVALLRVGTAGLRAFDVAGLDELDRAVDSLVQAALATGRRLGVDAVVARLSFASFASRHDSTSYRWGSHFWLLFQINQTFGRCTHI